MQPHRLAVVAAANAPDPDPSTVEIPTIFIPPSLVANVTLHGPVAPRASLLPRCHEQISFCGGELERGPSSGLPLFVPDGETHLLVLWPIDQGEAKLPGMDVYLPFSEWEKRGFTDEHPLHGKVFPCRRGADGEIIMPSGHRITFYC